MAETFFQLELHEFCVEFFPKNITKYTFIIYFDEIYFKTVTTIKMRVKVLS